MVGRSTRLQIIPQQSTQNTANFPLQTYEKTSELFNMGDNFSLRNNFDNSGSFAKVSIPVHIYNSLEKSNSNSELSPLYTCKISRLGNYQNLSYKQFLKANQNGNLHLWRWCAPSTLCKAFSYVDNAEIQDDVPPQNLFTFFNRINFRESRW